MVVWCGVVPGKRKSDRRGCRPLIPVLVSYAKSSCGLQTLVPVDASATWGVEGGVDPRTRPGSVPPRCPMPLNLPSVAYHRRGFQ